MKNINDKTKKWIVVAGGIVISAALIVMISIQFQKTPVGDTMIPNQSTESSGVTVEKPQITEKEDEIVVPPIDIPENKSANNGAVDKGTQQTIQGEVSKPEKPSNEKLTDPTQKPNGEKVTEPPKSVDHDKVVQPTQPPKKDSQPSGGDTNNKGQTYLPGFGWIENSGENQGTVVDGDGDINKQVGTMD